MKSLFLSTFLAVTCFLGASSSIYGASIPFDARFLDHMVDHHREAVQMGNLALEKSSKSELRKISSKIVRDQNQEIVKMKNWRMEFFPSVPLTKRSMPKMDMSELSSKRGRAFDIMFIDMMVEHHRSAVRMAREATQKSRYMRIRNFAHEIIKMQSKEIDQMLKIRNRKINALPQAGNAENIYVGP